MILEATMIFVDPTILEIQGKFHAENETMKSRS